MPREATLAPAAKTGSLIVEPDGIRFRNLDPTTVLLEVTISNPGHLRSDPTTMTVESAVFGAFVAPHRRFRLRVPAIGAGSAHVLRRRFGAPPPEAKESGRAPGSRPRTAIGSPDADLPRNPLELVCRGQVHWAGNFNVFIGDTPVERHRAVVRVVAGRENLALFALGSRRDAYTFETRGMGWERDLLAPRIGSPGDVGLGIMSAAIERIPEHRWFPVEGQTWVFVQMKPPLDAVATHLEVRVGQHSTGREASVEFDLDPRAPGPGCYVL